MYNREDRWCVLRPRLKIVVSIFGKHNLSIFDGYNQHVQTMNLNDELFFIRFECRPSPPLRKTVSRTTTLINVSISLGSVRVADNATWLPRNFLFLRPEERAGEIKRNICIATIDAGTFKRNATN